MAIKIIWSAQDSVICLGSCGLEAYRFETVFIPQHCWVLHFDGLTDAQRSYCTFFLSIRYQTFCHSIGWQPKFQGQEVVQGLLTKILFHITFQTNNNSAFECSYASIKSKCCICFHDFTFLIHVPSLIVEESSVHVISRDFFVVVIFNYLL